MAEQPISVRGVVIDPAELQWRFTAAGGPGGQHANTANTAAEVRFDVAASPSLTEPQRARVRRRLAARLTGEGVLIVRADGHRSQRRNRDEARDRLAALLEEALAPPSRPRRATKPSKAARRRRLDAKRRRGEIKALRRRIDP